MLLRRMKRIAVKGLNVSDPVLEAKLVTTFCRRNGMRWICDKNPTGDLPDHKICKSCEKCSCGSYPMDTIE